MDDGMYSKEELRARIAELEAWREDADVRLGDKNERILALEAALRPFVDALCVSTPGGCNVFVTDDDVLAARRVYGEPK